VPQAAGIATYLAGNPDYTVAAKFVQLADAPAIFGDSPDAGIVLFAAADSAWKTAADSLGASKRHCCAHFTSKASPTNVSITSRYICIIVQSVKRVHRRLMIRVADWD
jgi:hypothetical protein